MSMQASSLATLDSRKRINLASIATRENYLVTREPSGRIILDPAVVLTESELEVLNDPEIRASMEKARKTTERRPRRTL
jgi:hypothetical protein